MRSQYLVLALPYEAMARLLPHLPPAAGAPALAAQLAGHAHWPICSVHLWFDREITSLNHAVLLDRDIQLMILRRDTAAFTEAARAALRKALGRRLQKRPLVDVHLLLV